MTAFRYQLPLDSILRSEEGGVVPADLFSRSSLSVTPFQVPLDTAISHSTFDINVQKPFSEYVSRALQYTQVDIS